MSSHNYLQLSVDCRCYCCCCGTACIPEYVGSFNSNNTCSPLACNQKLPTECSLDGFIISERVYNNPESHYVMGAVAIVFLALLVLWVSSSLKNLNRNIYVETYRSRYIQLTRVNNSHDDDEPLPPYEGPKEEEAPPQVIFTIDEGDANDSGSGERRERILDSQIESEVDSQHHDMHDSDDRQINPSGDNGV